MAFVTGRRTSGRQLAGQAARLVAPPTARIALGSLFAARVGGAATIAALMPVFASPTTSVKRFAVAAELLLSQYWFW
jgi:hypothetical protein